MQGLVSRLTVVAVRSVFLGLIGLGLAAGTAGAAPDTVAPVAGTAAPAAGTATPAASRRPNILLAISDDQSFPHTSASGCRFVRTPAFDRVAAAGGLFTGCVAAAPGCSPNRAAILTGRPIGTIREAGTHASLFPRDLVTYPALLADAGYHVGFTGKGWGPGNHVVTGWDDNPVGPRFDRRKLEPPRSGLSKNDYAANFRDFLAARRPGQPFCFWYGAIEPHRPYAAGSGRAAGKDPATVDVPPFLPDTPVVRSDLLDYAVEIEWFDRHLALMLDALAEAGELDDTLVVVTSDNGMPFPRAKANLYEAGIHMPLAVAWPARFSGGREIDALVSHCDLAPTFLEAAGVAVPPAILGRSLLDLVERGITAQPAADTAAPREFVIAGRERHTSARPDNVGYPSRALRTPTHLYIRNLRPERFPAGDEGDDVDSGPTKSLMMDGRDDPAIAPSFALAFGLRPEHELFDVTSDPWCVRNLADDPAHRVLRDDLAARLEAELVRIGDPRAGSGGDIFESYPRFSAIRPLAGPDVTPGRYVRKFMQPDQDVLPELLPP
jgi:N-sulfoglucosamine sulfohydrolase